MRQAALWRVDSELEIVKAKLFSPQHDAAAIACRALTAMRAEVSAWDDDKCSSVFAGLSAQFRGVVVREAIEGERQLFDSIEAVFKGIGQAA